MDDASQQAGDRGEAGSGPQLESGAGDDGFATPQWIPRFFVRPEQYVDAGPCWETLDLETWSAAVYEYRRDDWNGLRNVPQEPLETVQVGTGDCEDYALVALSWLNAQDVDEAGLAVYYYGEDTFGHALAYGPERVYSSGVIYEASPREVLESSSFRVMFTNELD